MRQLNHRNSLRPEKKHEAENPKPDSHAAIRRNARYNVQVKYGDDEQRNQVPAPECSLQMRGLALGANFVWQKRLLNARP
jgi:hypothetical protein